MNSQTICLGASLLAALATNVASAAEPAQRAVQSRNYSLGLVASDMIEGRSFRTRLEDMLLPVFRFAGFGPIQGGTGEFAGVSGIMTMNSVISVQPRTLSNLYVLRLDDPDGRFRAAAQSASGGWAS